MIGSFYIFVYRKPAISINDWLYKQTQVSVYLKILVPNFKTGSQRFSHTVFFLNSLRWLKLTFSETISFKFVSRWVLFHFKVQTYYYFSSLRIIASEIYGLWKVVLFRISSDRWLGTNDVLNSLSTIFIVLCASVLSYKWNIDQIYL